MSARGSRSAVGVTAVLALLGALSCTMPTSPLPDGAERMDPPLIYRVWWQQVEACAEREGAFRDVTWYRVRRTNFHGFTHKGRAVLGLWAAQGNRIFLSEHVLDSAIVVRHEILHALLRTGEHPPRYFAAQCRAWVSEG